jgi:hypothetical protein
MKASSGGSTCRRCSGRFQDQWSPKIVGEVNDSLVKLVKLKGASCGIITRKSDDCFSWWG